MKKITILTLTLFLLITLTSTATAQNIEAYRTDNKSIPVTYNWNDKKQTLTIDETQQGIQFLKEAKISIPHEKLAKITTNPTLLRNGQPKRPYTKNNRTYHKIEITPTHYEFWTEQFSTWYVNSSGGNYTTITECLHAINNTANTCNINEQGYYPVNATYDFYITANAIILYTANITLEGNNSILRGNGGNGAIDQYRRGGNITIQHWRLDNWQNNIRMDNYNAAGNYNNSLINGINSRRGQFVLGFGGTNLTNSYIDRHTGTTTSFTSGTNYHVNNVTFNGSAIYGFTNDNFQDSTFNNITITINGQVGAIQIHGGGSQHIENNTYTNILINSPQATGINWATGGKGHDNNFTNITIQNCTTGIDIPDKHIRTERNRFTNINIQYASQYGFNIHSDYTEITNSTITNTGNTTQDKKYRCNNSPRTYSGTDYDYTNGMYFYVAPASFPLITTDGTDCTNHIRDGSQNISLCLMDVQGVGAAMATVLTDHNCTEAQTRLNGFYPGTTLDYEETYALWQNGAEQNYTGNYSPLTTPVTGYSGGAIWHETINNQTMPPIYITGDNNNITGNIIQTNDRTNYYGIKIIETADQTRTQNNQLRTNTLQNLGTNTNLCTNGIGNFYQETLTIPNNDCGMANTTYPTENQTYTQENNTINITWKQQDSRTLITYYIYYSLDNIAYILLDSTTNTNYEWQYDNIKQTTNYTNTTILIRPHDTSVWGTPEYQSFQLEKETRTSQYTILLLITYIAILLLLWEKNRIIAGITLLATSITSLYIGNIRAEISVLLILISLIIGIIGILPKKITTNYLYK